MIPTSHPRLIRTRLLACLALALLAAGCAAPATSSPTPTPEAVPPTATHVPPTSTSIPPTNTSMPPTSTAVPPTRTAIPPTSTSVQTTAPTNTAVPSTAPTATTAANVDPFTPKVASMFETAIGQDSMTGTCTGGPILPAYGLVVITPRGDSLTWDDQEPNLYTFFRTGQDAYYYAGPTGNGDGSVTLTLQFTNTDTLVMQRVFTPQNDFACQHTHNYTGEFQWLMP